jgi:hypothetical protein
MTFQPIEHKHFPDGACVIVDDRGKQWIFMYPFGEYKPGEFCLWFVDQYDNMIEFLDECASGLHSTLGVGLAGSFSQMMEELVRV